jgi:hypothetical protein
MSRLLRCALLLCLGSFAGCSAAEAKGNVSRAWALRRDLKRAFGVEVCREVVRERSNGRVNTAYVWELDPKREMTAREVELFEGTARNRPVDFHSFRRAFATGLRRAKVDARDAMRLAHVVRDAPALRLGGRADRCAARCCASEAPRRPSNPSIGYGRSQSARSSEKSLTIPSGWQDLNLQQPAPKAGPLPG